MPNHKSAAKRARQTVGRRERNRQHVSRMRTMIKRLQETEDKAAAETLLNATKAQIDQMASKGIIHKNKAANYKSQLEKHVNAL
ncbi:MAG: 30S ribosomal protein S20 [Bacteroidota bacterium]